MRLSLLDRPGVLARIMGCLGGHGISIASVLQKEESRGEHVPVIVITHEARENDVVRALAEIDTMDVVGDKTIRLRIEDEA
ncbi:MAG: ACT domain-containing protein [Lentisphaerae bacterium]|nr:ACT domain-containing protein [Lentisphaerota bacterium]